MYVGIMRQIDMIIIQFEWKYPNIQLKGWAGPLVEEL